MQHSRQRLDAAKQAVEAGMDKDDARRIKTRATVKKLEEIRAKKILNKF